MAAAYTALVSLTNTIDLIQNHSRHSFSFDKYQIDSLKGITRFLLGFIERYNSHGRSKEVEDLETQIASAACLAEDALESHVVDQILAGSTLDRIRPPNSSFLQTKMKAIKEKVMKVSEKIRSKVDAGYRVKMMFSSSPETSPSYLFDLEHLLHNCIYPIAEKVEKVEEENRVKDEQPTDLMAAASSTPLTSVVGFDDYSIQLMDVLTGNQSTRQIISVVGMGGLGKTTLANNVYQDLLIVQHFDIRAWATISQDFHVKNILLQLLSRKDDESTKNATVAKLGEELHKKLSGRRYLIVLDDMWSGEVWDKIRFCFPDNTNGSRIVVTTRLSYVATYFTSSSLVMDLLDEDKSWQLFCAKLFGDKEDCPVDLVEIGKIIVVQCRGLPLSIVVMAGHLRKSSRTKKEWLNVARNMTTVLNSGEDQCLSILSLSYSHLPAYLKPCFLYMGTYPEDKEVVVSSLVRSWVAEGILRSEAAESLEEMAEGYVKDLIDRNLISVKKRGRSGKVLTCNIHDLLRQVCLKVSEEEKFFCVLKHPEGASRRCDAASCPICHVRSFLWIDKSRLLRIPPKARQELYEDEFNPDCLVDMFQHLNMRCIFGDLHWNRSFESLDRHTTTIAQIRSHLPHVHLPSSIHLRWNLQTLVIRGIYARILVPVEIWEMPQLRHVDIHDLVRLSDPAPVVDDDDVVVMPNLQTLMIVENFKLVESVWRRIPNIKELQMFYNLEASSSLEYCQQNVGRFQKLESLRCEFDEESNWRVFAVKLRFPVSLKELWLGSSCLHWEDLSMIGWLPHLEVLTLSYENSIKGSEWNPIEGEFLGLKSLTIYNCVDLVCWNADKSHFPVLENVTLGYAYKLGEFPWDVGEIATLGRIYLDRCSVGAALSAMRIAVEQEELGNDDLRLKIKFKDEEELQSVTEMAEEEGIETTNFRLKYDSFH